MKRGPMRTVVSRETIDAACVRVHLTCGHAVVVYTSEAAERLFRCRECLEEHRHGKSNPQSDHVR